MRKTFALLLLLACFGLSAAVPTMQEHFGFTPGDDYKLADYEQIIGYFQKLEKTSNRLKMIQFGTTSEGRPMYLAAISSPENLQRLEEYRAINKKLALGQATPDEAAKWSRDGKALVWIDSGMHATEVAPAQHSPHLAYRMVTGTSAEILRILDKVILLQVPVENPDGLDMVAKWYTANVGTPYALANPPFLYQKYAGHDNNRDWFMMNLPETRHVSKALYEDWLPEIVYNQHQAPSFPARIFVPPYAEPLNPNIPAPVMEGINLIGAAMKERLAAEGKPGVLSYWGYDAWWNGGLRSVPAFHNMHGILTEVALYSGPTPFEYLPKHLPERFENGIPTKEPTVFYERPWLGGKWGTRAAIDYVLACDMAILDLASTRSEQYLLKAWTMAQDNIKAGQGGRPYAYVVSKEQWDKSAAAEMLSRLQKGGIEVQIAKNEFSVGAKKYPAGSYVMKAGQPFRAYLIDLMEPQKFPELRNGATGPIKRPYDIAGWTLPYLMGVKVDRADDVFQAELEASGPISYRPFIEHQENSSFLLLAEMLKSNQPVRLRADGNYVTLQDPPGYGFDAARWEMKTPRVGIYEPFIPNMDSGWTQWLLDYYQVPHRALKNADIQKGGLRSQFDAIILGQQSAASILYGVRKGEAQAVRNGDGKVIQRPEFTGGIELEGLLALRTFVEEGGTLLAFDSAVELPVGYFPLPVRDILHGAGNAPSGSGFFSPGSILRITVDTKNPLAFGMPPEAYVFSSGGAAFESVLGEDDGSLRSVAKYAKADLLASDFVQGERQVLGKDIMLEVTLGKGKVLLYGFRPQFRGQTFGTFKLVLNALYLAAANDLGAKSH